ncbi:MAG: Urease accessory protein UreD [Rhizobacter sp.]|nr:Urease accessory protein UreD [Rhizobacter sp.]
MPGWRGELALHYRSEPWGEGASQPSAVEPGQPPSATARRTVLHDRHSGPLRVLTSLYPERHEVCHNVVVHPPGGIVGGDTLQIDARLTPHAHALLTTPGATRFYRSAGKTALQQITATLEAGARLEWLPQETIVHGGALAENRMRFELAPGASMIGWDLLALGLPASGEAFEDARWPSRFVQQIELPRVWLERGVMEFEGRVAHQERVDDHEHRNERVSRPGHEAVAEAEDKSLMAQSPINSDALNRRLLDAPLGWAGKRVLGCMWAAGGSPLGPAIVEALLDAARQAIADDALAATAGATSPDGKLVVMRVLADRCEPASQLMQHVWAAWRQAMWSLPACAPRVWRT